MRAALCILCLLCCVTAGYGLLLTTAFYLGTQESFEEMQGERLSQFVAARYVVDLVVGLVLIAAYFVLEWLVRFFATADYPVGWRNVRFRCFAYWVSACVILLPPALWVW